MCEANPGAKRLTNSQCLFWRIITVTQVSQALSFVLRLLFHQKRVMLHTNYTQITQIFYENSYSLCVILLGNKAHLSITLGLRARNVLRNKVWPTLHEKQPRITLIDFGNSICNNFVTKSTAFPCKISSLKSKLRDLQGLSLSKETEPRYIDLCVLGVQVFSFLLLPPKKARVVGSGS